MTSTNLEYRAEKDGEKEKVGGMPAKLNEKKGDRGLERERKKKCEMLGPPMQGENKRQ